MRILTQLQQDGITTCAGARRLFLDGRLGRGITLLRSKNANRTQNVHWKLQRQNWNAQFCEACHLESLHVEMPQAGL